MREQLQKALHVWVSNNLESNFDFIVNKACQQAGIWTPDAKQIINTELRAIILNINPEQQFGEHPRKLTLTEENIREINAKIDKVRQLKEIYER